MDDVIKLVSIAYTKDEYGNQKPLRAERQVFCKVESIGRSEFYRAAQTDLHPEYVFTLSHYMDYLGETEVLYKDWTGTEKNYVVVRTYRVPGSDEIEITVEERIGRDGGSSGGTDEDSE